MCNKRRLSAAGFIRVRVIQKIVYSAHYITPDSLPHFSGFSEKSPVSAEHSPLPLQPQNKKKHFQTPLLPAHFQKKKRPPNIMEYLEKTLSHTDEYVEMISSVFTRDSFDAVLAHDNVRYAAELLTQSTPAGGVSVGFAVESSLQTVRAYEQSLSSAAWFGLLCMVAAVLVEVLHGVVSSVFMPNSFHVHIESVIELCITAREGGDTVGSVAAFYRRDLGYTEEVAGEEEDSACRCLHKDAHTVVVQGRGALLAAYPALETYLPEAAFRAQYLVVPDLSVVAACVPEAQMILPPSQHPVTKVQEMWIRDPLGNITAYAEQWR